MLKLENLDPMSRILLAAGGENIPYELPPHGHLLTCGGLAHDAVYLSGPMSGYEDQNRPLFFAVAGEIAHLVGKVINPGVAAAGLTWKEYMRLDLRWLTAEATAIMMLPGWRQSRGARLECCVALSMGLKICEYR